MIRELITELMRTTLPAWERSPLCHPWILSGALFTKECWYLSSSPQVFKRPRALRDVKVVPDHMLGGRITMFREVDVRFG